MKVNTKQRKKATHGFQEIYGKGELANRMFHILTTGKQGIDCPGAGTRHYDGPGNHGYGDERSAQVLTIFPGQKGVYKWAYQPGSIYLGDQKVSVRHPRLRGPEGEIPLQSYRNVEGVGRILGRASQQSAPGHISTEVPGNRV